MGIGSSILSRTPFSKFGSNASMQCGDSGKLCDQAVKSVVGLESDSPAIAPQPPLAAAAAAATTKTELVGTPEEQQQQQQQQLQTPSPVHKPKFNPHQILEGVKRDNTSPMLWRADYPASPIKTVRTSPSSYMMSSETALAYPSPSKLHSPPLSYASSFNKVSPVRHQLDLFPSADTLPNDPSRYGKEQPAIFYSGIPSPSWQPISRQSPRSNSSTSLIPQGSWKHPSQGWGHHEGQDRRRGRTKERVYYCDEDDRFYSQPASEVRYF